MSFHNKWKIKQRIACPEDGYPAGEARFDSIEDYLIYLIFHYRRGNLIKIALQRFYTEAYNKGFDSGKEI